jgi:four helix bundle protein
LVDLNLFMSFDDSISIQERSKLFAIRVVKAYAELNQRNLDDAGKILAKQLLRSGTSIGANLSEGKFAQSKADFISKYSIALKEASETCYWIEIMVESGIVKPEKFALMLEEVNRIISILVTTLKKLKNT